MDLTDEITLESIRSIIENEDGAIKTIGFGHYLVAKFTADNRDNIREDYLAIGIMRGVKEIIQRTKDKDPALGFELEESIFRMINEE